MGVLRAAALSQGDVEVECSFEVPVALLVSGFEI